MTPMLFFGSGIAATVLFVIARHLVERRRRGALEAAVQQMGLQFLPEDGWIAREPFTSLPCFARGHSPTFLNVAFGDRLWVFDFRYTEGRGRDSSEYTQTVAAVQLASGDDLADFSLQPERIYDRVAPRLSDQDLDFDSDTAFSNAFRLRGSDEKATRALFEPELRRPLLDASDLCLEGEGRWIVIWRQDRRVKPGELPAFIARARGIAAQFEER